MGTTQLCREPRPDGEPLGTRLVSVLVLGAASQVSQYPQSTHFSVFTSTSKSSDHHLSRGDAEGLQWFPSWFFTSHS